MLTTGEKTWTQWLGPLVPNLPPYKTVIEELRPQVDSLLGQENRQPAMGADPPLLKK